MEVILLSDVEKVGLRGDVVSVARGYARNFLLPRRLAEEATPAKVAELRKREEQRSRHEAQTFDQAQQLAQQLRDAELRFDVQAGTTGTLFGSVTATNVADALWEQRKIRVDRRKIDLHDPIKRIGRYEIPIDLFQDVRVEVRTLVVPEGGELPPDEELEAMQAEERAEAAPPAGDSAGDALDAAEAAGPSEPPAEVQQHPEDAFDLAVDAALEAPGENL